MEDDLFSCDNCGALVYEGDLIAWCDDGICANCYYEFIDEEIKREEE
jgi:hypothetical protein